MLKKVMLLTASLWLGSRTIPAMMVAGPTPIRVKSMAAVICSLTSFICFPFSCAYRDVLRLLVSLFPLLCLMPSNACIHPGEESSRRTCFRSRSGHCSPDFEETHFVPFFHERPGTL